jgi:competence protein ComEC
MVEVAVFPYSTCQNFLINTLDKLLGDESLYKFKIPTIMSFTTKFTAFQLDSPGSLFSYYKQDTYCLIEARLPKGGMDALLADMAHHNKSRIDVLHITSWDSDHCTFNDLVPILNQLRPNKIEVPDYYPASNDGELCRKVIFEYDAIHQTFKHNVQVVSKTYINQLATGQAGGVNNIVYHSMYGSNNKNDMSLIKLFRSAGFNVLSVGDCEAAEIADYLMKDSFIQSEVDVLILAHHGADNGFTTGKLLDAIRPKIAICSSNYDNQYEHPDPGVCSLLTARNIPLMTTKRGNVTIYQLPNSSSAIAANLASNNEIVETRIGFTPKRFEKVGLAV